MYNIYLWALWRDYITLWRAVYSPLKGYMWNTGALCCSVASLLILTEDTKSTHLSVSDLPPEPSGVVPKLRSSSTILLLFIICCATPLGKMHIAVFHRSRINFYVTCQLRISGGPSVRLSVRLSVGLFVLHSCLTVCVSPGPSGMSKRTAAISDGND